MISEEIPNSTVSVLSRKGQNGGFHDTVVITKIGTLYIFP